MKKSTQKIIYMVLLMSILAVAIIYAYFQMTGKKEEQVPKTKVEKLIHRNLEGTYPATPREVMKVYGELTKYLYNGNEEKKMSDEQFEALFDQVRILYSEELLEENPREVQLERLKMDVADYKKMSKTIMSYNVQQSSQIEFGELNGSEVAKVVVSFTTKASGEQPAKTYERFLLQADANERWKIVGWEQISGEGLE
ncbi:MAG: DUF6715 family protein [Acetivibrio ethanolgignens]